MVTTADIRVVSWKPHFNHSRPGGIIHLPNESVDERASFFMDGHGVRDRADRWISEDLWAALSRLYFTFFVNGLSIIVIVPPALQGGDGVKDTDELNGY
jgi:hypothetical protein